MMVPGAVVFLRVLPESSADFFDLLVALEGGTYQSGAQAGLSEILAALPGAWNAAGDNGERFFGFRVDGALGNPPPIPGVLIYRPGDDVPLPAVPDDVPAQVARTRQVRAFLLGRFLSFLAGHLRNPVLGIPPEEVPPPVAPDPEPEPEQPAEPEVETPDADEPDAPEQPAPPLPFAGATADRIEVVVRTGLTLAVQPLDRGYRISFVYNGRAEYIAVRISPPWQSVRIMREEGNNAAEALARLGVGAEVELRGEIGRAWTEIQARITGDPETALATERPAVRHALSRVTAVRVVRGEDTITEIDVLGDSGEPVTLQFTSEEWTGPATVVNKRWHNAFAPDELNATKEDWPQIRHYLGSIAVVVEREQFSTTDVVLDLLAAHLRRVPPASGLPDLLLRGYRMRDQGGLRLPDGTPSQDVTWFAPSVIGKFVADSPVAGLTTAKLARILRRAGVMPSTTVKINTRLPNAATPIGRMCWPILTDYVRPDEGIAPQGGAGQPGVERHA